MSRNFTRRAENSKVSSHKTALRHSDLERSGGEKSQLSSGRIFIATSARGLAVMGAAPQD